MYVVCAHQRGAYVLLWEWLERRPPTFSRAIDRSRAIPRSGVPIRPRGFQEGPERSGLATIVMIVMIVMIVVIPVIIITVMTTLVITVPTIIITTTQIQK